MRRIEFSGKDDRSKREFALLYRAWMGGKEIEGRENITIAGAITKKVMDLSHKDGDMLRLKDGGGTLELNEREFEMLRSHCEAATFPTSMTHHAPDLYECLAGAEKVEDPAAVPIDKPVTGRRPRRA